MLCFVVCRSQSMDQAGWVIKMIIVGEMEVGEICSDLCMSILTCIFAHKKLLINSGSVSSVILDT